MGFLAAIVAGIGREIYGFVNYMRHGYTFKQALNANAFDGFDLVATVAGGFIITAIWVVFYY